MERLTTIALGLLSSIVFLVRDDKGLFLRIGLADTSVHRSIGRSSVRVSAELDFFLKETGVAHPYSTEIDSKKDPRFMYKVSGERERRERKNKEEKKGEERTKI